VSNISKEDIVKLKIILAFMGIMLLASAVLALAGVNYNIVPRTWWGNAADYIEERDTSWFDYSVSVFTGAMGDTADAVRGDIRDTATVVWTDSSEALRGELRDSTNAWWADTSANYYPRGGHLNVGANLIQFQSAAPLTNTYYLGVDTVTNVGLTVYDDLMVSDRLIADGIHAFGLWGYSTGYADSFSLTDDGDTTRFESGNPIKIGDASLIISTGGDVSITGDLTVGAGESAVNIVDAIAAIDTTLDTMTTGLWLSTEGSTQLKTPEQIALSQRITAETDHEEHSSRFVNSSAGNAVTAEASSGMGIYASSSSNIGVAGHSGSNYGGYFYSGSSYSIRSDGHTYLFSDTISVSVVRDSSGITIAGVDTTIETVEQFPSEFYTTGGQTGEGQVYAVAYSEGDSLWLYYYSGELDAVNDSFVIYVHEEMFYSAFDTTSNIDTALTVIGDALFARAYGNYSAWDSLRASVVYADSFVGTATFADSADRAVYADSARGAAVAVYADSSGSTASYAVVADTMFAQKAETDTITAKWLFSSTVEIDDTLYLDNGILSSNSASIAIDAPDNTGTTPYIILNGATEAAAPGGGVNIIGGNGTTGGGINLQAGVASSPGLSGSVAISGGSNSVSGGSGGEVTILGGNATGAGIQAGKVSIDAGNPKSGATGARVKIAYQYASACSLGYAGMNFYVLADSLIGSPVWEGNMEVTGDVTVVSGLSMFGSAIDSTIWVDNLVNNYVDSCLHALDMDTTAMAALSAYLGDNYQAKSDVLTQLAAAYDSFTVAAAGSVVVGWTVGLSDTITDVR